MKSKFRIWVFIIGGLLLLALGFASFLMIFEFINKYFVLKTQSILSSGSDAMAFIFPILFIFLLFWVIAFTKTIEFKEDLIFVNYIFRFKTYSYRYVEIYGYRWEYSSARLIDDVSIRIKTNTNKIFSLSDIVYSNYRELEKIVTNRIPLKVADSSTDEWLTPSQKRKELILYLRANFDIEQAKNLRIFSCLNGLLSLSLLSLAILIKKKTPYEFNDSIIIIFFSLLLFFSVKTFIKKTIFIRQKKKERKLIRK